MDNFWFQFLWRLWKWCLRLWTGRCELQRICAYSSSESARTIRLEQCLKRSRYEELRMIASGKKEGDPVLPEDALQTIIRIKHINTAKDPSFIPRMRHSLLLIVAMNMVERKVSALQRESYSEENSKHEQMLLKLWALLMPLEELADRYSKQWEKIGFQGKNPATDFRGMGILGLHCLIFFSESYKDKAGSVLLSSQHPKGYPFAIGGINLVSLVHGWLVKEDTLRYYFYRRFSERPATLQDFMEVFCYVFHAFDQLWREEKPENVMAFSRIRQQFAEQLHSRITSLDEQPLDMSLREN